MRCATLALLACLIGLAACAANDHGPASDPDSDPPNDERGMQVDPNDDGPGADPGRDSDPAVDPRAMQAEPSPSTMHPTETTGGETGSMGAVQCSRDSECMEMAQAVVDQLSGPLTFDRALIGSECVARDDGDPRHCCYHAPAACLCYYGWGGSTTRDHANAFVLGNRQDCDEWGRALECLSSAADFAGCDPGDATSCDKACAELDAKLNADLAKSIDAEVRSACCDPSGICRTVTRIEDRCYAAASIGHRAFDCALSDDEILAMEFGSASRSQCGDQDSDGGAAAAAGSSTPRD